MFKEDIALVEIERTRNILKCHSTESCFVVEILLKKKVNGRVMSERLFKKKKMKGGQISPFIKKI